MKTNFRNWIKKKLFPDYDEINDEEKKSAKTFYITIVFATILGYLLYFIFGPEAFMD